VVADPAEVDFPIVVARCTGIIGNNGGPASQAAARRQSAPAKSAVGEAYAFE